METFYRVIRDEIGQKVCGIDANYPHVRQDPSANAVDGIAVVFAGPFNAEEIDIWLGHSMIEQKGGPTGADFNMDGTGTSENLYKIDFAI